MKLGYIREYQPTTSDQALLAEIAGMQGVSLRISRRCSEQKVEDRKVTNAPSQNSKNPKSALYTTHRGYGTSLTGSTI